jgi:hypothetical protein
LSGFHRIGKQRLKLPIELLFLQYLALKLLWLNNVDGSNYLAPLTWFQDALTPARIEIFPLTPDIATCAVNLSPIHRDPFDRLIIATALTYQANLASVDGVFSQYSELDGYLMR